MCINLRARRNALNNKKYCLHKVPCTTQHCTLTQENMQKPRALMLQQMTGIMRKQEKEGTRILGQLSQTQRQRVVLLGAAKLQAASDCVRLKQNPHQQSHSSRPEWQVHLPACLIFKIERCRNQVMW